MEYLIPILVIILLIAIFVMSTYNSLVSLRNRVRNAFAQMDVQMKMRADLIPSLVETVKGAAGHERGTLESVIKARQQVLDARSPEEKMQANSEMSNALSRLMVVVEQYPQLQANSTFQQMMTELRDTEDKIRFSRQFYNDTVQNYNTKLEVFPSNLIANTFGFVKEKFFEITEADRKNPNVDFSNLYSGDYQKVSTNTIAHQEETPLDIKTNPHNPVSNPAPQDISKPIDNDNIPVDGLRGNNPEK